MHFRKAADKVNVNLPELTSPFKKMKENSALIEAVNELLDARTMLPFRLEAIKGTSKDEARIALFSAGMGLVTAVQKLFLNKLPIGYDRFGEMATIWLTVASAITSLKSIPRYIGGVSSSELRALLKKDLVIEVYRNDQQGNKIANSSKKLKIGTLEEFLEEKENLIFKALIKNGFRGDSNYQIEFGPNSAQILLDAYTLIKKIDMASLWSMLAAGVGVATVLTPQISAKLHGEPTDTLFGLFGDKTQAKDFPPKPSSIISNPSFTQQQLRGRERL